MVIYTVKPGDSLYSIARSYGTTVSRIVTDNDLEDPENLTVGQTLVLLFPTRTHTVRSGDTLSSIAAAYGVTQNQLWRNNPALGGSDFLIPGQTLNVSYETPPLGAVRTNGYAYPNIERAVLRRTLPYLSYLSIFTYGIRPDGTLIPPPGGDEELISLSRAYGTVPLMMLTSLTESGVFSNELVAQILGDAALSQTVIDQAVRTMREKGYGGIDVDFEYIDAAYTAAYPAFLSRLKAQMGEGGVLFASLAPKNAADQPGLLYEGHDYGAIGAAANDVLLMTYEWGYTYGPPLAVAPIYEVLRVLAYGVSEIPPSKLLLGIANYGYDWTLPYQEGSAARSLSNPQAVDLAWRYGAEIVYDEDAQAPNFSYVTSEGVAHQVWFEDVRSLRAKLEAARNFGLKGVNFWTVNRPFPSGFMLMGREYVPEALP
jgi:spore germination protein